MDRMTYQNLRAQMALRGHSLGTLAQAVQIKYPTFCRKMRRLSPFTLEECLRIREVLRFSGSLDALFLDHREDVQ